MLMFSAVSFSLATDNPSLYAGTVVATQSKQPLQDVTVSVDDTVMFTDIQGKCAYSANSVSQKLNYDDDQIIFVQL